jgi:AraC-like DNA-binding protein
MDPLSDLLRVVRLDGAYFYAVEAAEPWGIQTVPADEFRPRIMPAADHLISYHVVVRGRCYAGLAGEEQIELVAGDVILFPHGDAHLMSSAPELRVPPDLITEPSGRPGQRVELGEAGARDVSLLCGFLGCDRRPFNPLLSALPRRLHVRGLSAAWLGGFTRLFAEEYHPGRAGADTVLVRAAELMFVEAVRRHLESLPPEQTGWLAGLRDELVGRALTLLHARPGDDWSLDTLAREIASSRSVVARRFSELVGQPPMQYLTQWRMQVAANRLVQSGAKIAAIGAEVGYDSEAAFSRAFKKVTGVAPGAWRGRRRTPQS